VRPTSHTPGRKILSWNRHADGQAGAPVNSSNQESVIMSWFWGILFKPDEVMSGPEEEPSDFSQLQMDLDQQNRNIRDLASAIVEALGSDTEPGC
jgi:hypothetical protein